MTLTRTEIAPGTALKLVTEATAYAAAQGWDVAAAVADPHGALVALLRTDHVVIPAVGFAIDKAYTAATLRKSTEAFYERAASNPALSLGLGNRARLMVWSGGLPLFADGHCIGGLGVSGAQDHEDIEAAQAAIRAAGLAWEP